MCIALASRVYKNIYFQNQKNDKQIRNMKTMLRMLDVHTLTPKYTYGRWQTTKYSKFEKKVLYAKQMRVYDGIYNFASFDYLTKIHATVCRQASKQAGESFVFPFHFSELWKWRAAVRLPSSAYYKICRKYSIYFAIVACTQRDLIRFLGGIFTFEKIDETCMRYRYDAIRLR